eukprot:7007688-Lingulodinium_polyedra.AAC.1
MPRGTRPASHCGTCTSGSPERATSLAKMSACGPGASEICAWSTAAIRRRARATASAGGWRPSGRP